MIAYCYDMQKPSSGLTSAFPFQVISEKPPAVLVVMAINTEILPVRAVRRIVVMIPVLMVHSEKIPAFEIEFFSAFGADQAVDFQGLFSVVGCVGSALF